MDRVQKHVEEVQLQAKDDCLRVREQFCKLENNVTQEIGLVKDLILNVASSISSIQDLRNDANNV